MLKNMKKLLTALAALLMIAALVPASAENEAMLQLTFIGMYVNSDGTYTARNLPGQFEVLQNGKKVGVITSDESGSQPFTLSKAGNVQLMPVMDTIPEEIAVNENGYVVSIVPGQFNVAPVVVYAEAGLFAVHTESSASFVLINERGEDVLRFSTDSRGDYALPTSIAAGQYTLRMEEASLAISKWRDKIINIEPYVNEDSVLYVDASYFYYPEITLKPATPTPEATATPAPTSKPTSSMFENVKTGADTQDEPEATATPVPTATPTATPVPTDGTLVLNVYGKDASADFTVAAGGVTYHEGTLTTGTSSRVPGLPVGNYIVTVNMDNDVMLTELNGYASIQRRSAQWLVSITAGKTSLYDVELSLVGSVTGTLSGVEGANLVSISGSEIYNLTATDRFAQSGMIPDAYAVTVVLPHGEYYGDGWTFVESAGQMLAITRAVVEGGSEIELPEIAAKVFGEVGGVVWSRNEKPMSGVQVVICDLAGNELLSTETDKEGRWHIVSLEEGIYAVQYRGSSRSAFATGTFEISELSRSPELQVIESAPASVLVQVFVDENNNGVWGKNEPYMPGAVIQLVKRMGGEDVVMASAVTDRDGCARLTAPAGKYTLRCELPEDYGYGKIGEKDLISNSAMDQEISRVQELKDVSLSTDAEKEIGIGAVKMATLTGTVWEDVNGDGLWQKSEPGVEGMRIVAEGLRNGLVYETRTDADGRFEISQIRNGTYEVTYHVPNGYVATIKGNGNQQQRSLMTTEADRKGVDQVVFDKGITVDEQNIGLVREAAIIGYCFLDENYNGYFDEGERPVSGVEVELIRQSNSKRLQTATSGADGSFRFGNVRGDTFKVKALLPKDTTYTIRVPGDWDANQFEPREGKREQTVTGVTVKNGETFNMVIGAIRYGSISGVVYEDDNFSGSWETGEKIVAGMAVYLLDDSGDVVQVIKTNKNGAYTFENLAPGEYSLKMTAKTGYAFTQTGAGSVIENRGGGEGQSELFNLKLGQTLNNRDIGMIVPAVVRGVAFADANDNGLYDSGEKGLVGTVVSLMQEDGVVDSMKVKADGTFVFDSVLPGRYYLRYELPDNGVFSPRVQGGNQVVGEGSDGAGDWFNVKVGQEWVAPVCGGLDLGIVTGYAYADSNGNGEQDADEALLAGMTLVLTPSREELEVRTAVTGADGAFSFEALRPDQYTLTVNCPEGYVLSRMDNVTLGLAHGLAEQSITLKVGMGNAWTEQALGCVLPASYSGAAWLDENMDGLHGEDEKPAAGETLKLYDQNTSDLIATIVTDEQGEFTAEGLAPGAYKLVFDLADDVQSSVTGDTTFIEDGDALVMENIVIAEGTHVSGARLGLVRETTLSGLVWLDSDGETLPVEGAEITLEDGAGEEQTFITAADGRYTFEGLTPGQYRISVVLPEGCVAIEPGDRRLAEGAQVSILESTEANIGESGWITVKMAEHQLALDIGSVRPGRLGDFCWLDLNGNGLQDGDEGGIPGVEILLIRNGVVAARAISDQYGYFVIKNLYPGEYIIRAVWPEVVKPTQQRTDLPMIVSVIGENGESGLVAVVSDGANYDADLGFVLVDGKTYPAGYGEGATQNWEFDR